MKRGLARFTALRVAQKSLCCHNMDRCAAWCGLNSTFYAATHAEHEGFRVQDFSLTGII